MELLQMIFRKGELFCGPGGLALGAKEAVDVFSKSGERFSVVHEWANDIDEDACNTFRLNICPDRPESVIQGDVRNLNIKKLGRITAFAFGFPCNDYSLVGKRRGLEGEYGPLYSYGIKVLNIHEPYWFIAENVTGLTSANDGEAFVKILSEMAEAGSHGYELTPHLYKFEEYGVPQTRHRIIIVGIRKDFNLKFRVPYPSHKNKYVTAKEVLERPYDENVQNHDLPIHKPNVIEMLNKIPPGGNAWHEDVPEQLRLNVKGTRISQIYRRLAPDRPAYTVTGSGGGGTHMYHYAEPRALTNRERARLQTFPDHFVFTGGRQAVRKQIGMAVPPLGAKIIVEAILKTFARVPYETVESSWTFDYDLLGMPALIKNQLKEEQECYLV